MSLPSVPSLSGDMIQLGPLLTPRVWVGLWQLSSSAWGSTSVAKIRQGFQRYFDSGNVAFDMADHYGSAELIFGQCREAHSDPTLRIIGATKWCVFKPITVDKLSVLAAVQERNLRMRSKSVDLLQIHWQDYSDKGYLAALRYLLELKNEGIISALGLCNFDSARTDEICTELGPEAIVSNQVQFSVIDVRPLHGMVDVCIKHGLKLLTYGTLCGGFLADRWMGKPEPEPYSNDLTPSQRKYLDMIRAWGTWGLFQELLSVLHRIGQRHGGMSVSNIATLWVLDQPCVGAVIIGARLGISEHIEDNRKLFGFNLTSEDKVEVDAVLDRSKGRTIITTIGDCGAEYRA